MKSIEKFYIITIIDDEIKLSIINEHKVKFHLIRDQINNGDELSNDEKKIIVGDILSNKLEFYHNGNPTEETVLIENLIDIFNS
ncbi:hypothetical protein [Acinetobacter parvus]|uniref:Uncharacterized protein n=1 Tax=Acinetobacter parvus NIPH 1103 TaxID=1217671 RepID=N8RGE2_9GAMM|nr:hypothetical protein [Acinetobacter parvus]ENU33157.1 hypothetical protein F989_01847 [Acinetobacter parvus NIPH 1103]